MAFLGGKVAIVGVGASSFERRPDASVFQFADAALNAALADGGLEKPQIDGLIVQVGSPRGADYDGIAETFGLEVGFCSQTWSHGRFAATVLAHAAMAVSSGLATRVACLMAMKNSDLGRIGEADNPFFHEQFRENGGPHGEAGHVGMSSPVAGAAMAFDLYCRRYGHDRELLAEIPIAFRTHAMMTDDAVMRTPIGENDYRSSRPIIEPLRMLDCSPVGDGAVCMIVGGADQPRAIRMTGTQGLRASRNAFIFAPLGLGMGQQSERRLTRAEARGQRVFQMAGASPETIDVAGVYDSFSPLPLYALEDFGFCEAGEALRWIQGERIRLGGELPVNTSGGQLSQAQMNGWGQLRELVVQLRGEAGGRQVVNARRGMWMTAGGDSLILERA